MDVLRSKVVVVDKGILPDYGGGFSGAGDRRGSLVESSKMSISKDLMPAVKGHEEGESFKEEVTVFQFKKT